MGWGSFWEGITEAFSPKASDYTPYQSGDLSRSIDDFTARYKPPERVDIVATPFDQKRYGNYQRGDASAAIDAFTSGRSFEDQRRLEYERRQGAALTAAFDAREGPDDEPPLGYTASGEEALYEVTYDAYGASGQVISENGLLIPAGSAAFFGSKALLGASDADELFDAYLAGTGVEELGVDVNWFPGMELKAPNSFYEYVATPQSGMSGLRGHLEYEGSIPEAWAVGQLATVTDGDEQVGQIWTHYDVSKSIQSFAAMGEDERLKYTDLMVEAGLLPDGYAGMNQFTMETSDRFRHATVMANYYGISVEKYLDQQAEHNEYLKKNSGGGGGGGGAARRYTIEIPDYDTILQRSTEMLRNELGREPKDWEVTLVGDEMKRQYGAWAAGQKQKALGGNGVYEIPDPTDMTQSFIESEYEAEIGRIENVEEQAQNHQLLVAAATKGASMNGTSARNLQ